ncbi:MAG TPA: peroxiredoxin [Acidimicrobiales bacterium]|jgi:peroxiredoxin
MATGTGQEAPDFELGGANVDGKLKLSSLRGHKAAAIVFYPFTFTGVCHGELCALRDDIGDFEAAGVQVIAISCDSPFAQQRWAEAEGYTFPVLSDFWPHGEVSRSYGVFNEDLGAAMRGTFLVGKDGTIVDVFESADLRTPRDKARYDDAIATLS